LNLNSIFFVDADNGFCAGGNYGSNSSSNVLLRTTNGGDDWEEIALDITYPINKISFINDTVGFMCGGIPSNNGFTNTAIFLKTNDGGSSWNSQSFDINNFTSLYFVNENIGYLITEWRYYYKTTDSGDNWELNQIIEDGGYINDVYFTNENNGWIIGGGGGWGARIHSTTNAGLDWQTKVEWGSGHYSAFNDFEYINSNSGYLVGYLGEIRKTTDFGNNWILITRGFSSSAPPFFLNSNIGWAANPNTIYYTTNRGFSWNSVPNTSGVVNFKFINENFGYGLILNSIATTADGGQNWNQYPIEYSNWNLSLKSVHHYNELNGIAWMDYIEPIMGGMGVLVVKTTDGWLSKTFNGMYAHYIKDGAAYSNFAWAVGEGPDGKIFRSSDYGNNWQTIQTSYTNRFSKIFVQNSSNVWITASDIIIKSTDTGLTWNEIVIPQNYKCQYIEFLDVNDEMVWMLVTTENWNSKILVSSNGGSTWAQSHLELPGYFSSIKLTDDEYLLALTDNGKILMTNNLITDVNDFTENPIEGFSLNQNYPNPFNPITQIKYKIHKAGNIKIEVYDLLGKKIKTLVNEYKNAGEHSIEFNGEGHPSGIYFYRISAENYSKTKKMVLLK
jgi:photosystem II stability/assembly factor-like uncharacterized protein